MDLVAPPTTQQSCDTPDSNGIVQTTADSLGGNFNFGQGNFLPSAPAGESEFEFVNC
jgi:hypothetical protein